MPEPVVPIEHQCIVAGGAGIACFGFGSLRGGTIRFACRQHRHLLNPPLPVLAGPAAPAQGSLF